MKKIFVILIHITLTILTAGLWLFGLIVYYLIKNAKKQAMMRTNLPTNVSDTSNPSKIIKTKVVGVTFEGRQELLKRCYARQKLKIINQPIPDHPNAMAVYAGVYHIGHIKSELAQQLCENKKEYTGVITELTGGTKDRPTRGCNIEINV